MVRQTVIACVIHGSRVWNDEAVQRVIRVTGFHERGRWDGGVGSRLVIDVLVDSLHEGILVRMSPTNPPPDGSLTNRHETKKNYQRREGYSRNGVLVVDVRYPSLFRPENNIIVRVDTTMIQEARRTATLREEIPPEHRQAKKRGPGA
jgi:hypothetical protein